MEDWAEIRRLHRAEQMPIRAIARHLGISKNTVKRALASDRPPQYRRPAKGSVVDAVEVQIRELLRDTPTMPATVIAERIGWERGMTILKDRIRNCGRPMCRSIRSRARSIGPASWPSATCGSPTRTTLSAMGRADARRSW
ncbi:helix-turn-helix domain-containing protein [Streptomyces avermitilis]|uniref:helix-turn-helix domain-containing protein n=1 Tax=Streptomyces avermitilis TaxID=33903 RepID=UPI003BB5B092